MLMFVYMAVTEVRNNAIKQILERKVEEIDNEEKLMILGDFNGHLGSIGPQEINWNGKKTKLMLLNGDDKSKG